MKGFVDFAQSCKSAFFLLKYHQCPVLNWAFLFTMTSPERTQKGTFEKSFLLEEEPIIFVLKSLTPEGLNKEREIKDMIEHVSQGQFRGDVLKLKNSPWVIKTAYPTATKYGVPLRRLRDLHEEFKPFFPQHFESEAKLEHVGQKILRLLLGGYFGGKYYVPDSTGYTVLPGIGFCQVIEKMEFKNPHSPEEIDQIFQAQHELTEFCRQFGLVELSSQIHKENPLAPSNLVLLKDEICWLDVHPGIKMNPSGYVPPIFIFPFHRKICRQTIEDGELVPAFNRIHLRVCAAAVEENMARLEGNIGQKGLQELTKWMALYGSLLKEHNELSQLPTKDQWVRAWKMAEDVPLSVAEKVDKVPALYLLARIFTIRTVMFFLDNEYRKWVVDGLVLAERRKQSLERFRKKQERALFENERVGKNQRLDSNSSLILNTAAGRIFPLNFIIRPWIQRLANDPQFRNIEEFARYFVLSGARDAQKNNIISLQELETLRREVNIQKLEPKKLSIYLLTFLMHQAIARGADIYEIGNYLASIISPEARLQRIAMGFIGGWIVPVALRLAFTKPIELLSKEDLSTAIRWLFIPKLGHYIAIPDQVTVALGNPGIRNFAIRGRIATLTSILPIGGWGTKLEMELWKRFYPKPEGSKKK